MDNALNLNLESQTWNIPLIKSKIHHKSWISIICTFEIQFKIEFQKKFDSRPNYYTISLFFHFVLTFQSLDSSKYILDIKIHKKSRYFGCDFDLLNYFFNCCFLFSRIIFFNSFGPIYFNSIQIGKKCLFYFVDAKGKAFLMY